MEISNGILTATINPQGAELTSLKSSRREYIWKGDPKYWGKHSPVLFPIVGTLRNNTYIYNGQVYAMGRHGFARDNMFQVKEQTKSSLTFVLVATDDTQRMYPFDFELELKYTLQDTALAINYTVTNKDSKDMPFALGAHPAFALPDNFNSYSLKFEKNEQLVSRQLEKDLISNKTIEHSAEHGILPLDYKLFENDALIFTQLQSRAIDLMEGDKALVKVQYDKFPHLGIWTKADAPFICIEPWQGYSDTADCSGNITEKEGMLTLQPAEQYTAMLAIEIL